MTNMEAAFASASSVAHGKRNVVSRNKCSIQRLPDYVAEYISNGKAMLLTDIVLVRNASGQWLFGRNGKSSKVWVPLASVAVLRKNDG